MSKMAFLQGMEPVDLLHNRHILPSKAVPVPKPRLHAELWNSLNCSPDIFRSTLTKIPETESILKKSRLPLGILIHPFKDLSHLPVIQCQTIVRYELRFTTGDGQAVYIFFRQMSAVPHLYQSLRPLCRPEALEMQHLLQGQRP